MTSINEKIPSLMFDNNHKALFNEKEKAEAFAEHFSNISNEQSNLGSKYFSSKIDREIKIFMKSSVITNEISFIKFAKLTRIIKNFKNKKTPGHDNISVIILQNFPRKALVFVLKIRNGILLAGHYPDIWKIAKVIPVPKKGKDSSKLYGYRPISLLFRLNKIIEKLIKSGIVKFVHEN